MPVFKGSHGTTEARAKEILAHHFQKAPGRIGIGAYFWTAPSDEHLPLANDFASRWATRRNPYSKVAVLNVEVDVEEDDVLQLDDPDHHLDLRLLLASAVQSHFKVSSPFDVSRDEVKKIHPALFGIVEGYIRLVENSLGHELKVVFKCQVPPVDDPLKEIIGLTTCFSVRNNSCITEMQVI